MFSVCEVKRLKHLLRDHVKASGISLKAPGNVAYFGAAPLKALNTLAGSCGGGNKGWGNPSDFSWSDIG